jgi:hypothetical protein
VFFFVRHLADTITTAIIRNSASIYYFLSLCFDLEQQYLQCISVIHNERVCLCYRPF